MYRDQLFALYSNCVVTAADYDIRCASASANPIYVSTLCTRSAGVTSDLNETCERGEASRAQVVTTAHPIVLKGHVDIAKHLGVTRTALLTDDLYSQSSSGTPTNVLYMNLSAVDATSSGSVVYFNIKLQLTCRFRRLVEVGSS